MEKDQNNNSMNEAATMPSYFPCIKSSESHPLADFLKPTYMFQLDFDHVKKEDMVIEKEPIELNSELPSILRILSRTKYLNFDP